MPSKSSSNKVRSGPRWLSGMEGPEGAEDLGRFLCENKGKGGCEWAYGPHTEVEEGREWTVHGARTLLYPSNSGKKRVENELLGNSTTAHFVGGFSLAQTGLILVRRT